MHPALGLVVGYLLGSIPFAFLAGRLLRGIDLRQHGSGNLGATNVARTLGWRAAVTVLVLDTAKGVIPVLLLPRLFPSPHSTVWALGYGCAAIVGHVRPVFLLGHGGGKGVATAAGMFLALAPGPTLVAVDVFAVVLLATRFVSVASMAAAIALPTAVLVAHGRRSPVFMASVAIALFVFWTHRANIGRLRRGEEHRFEGRRRPASPAAGPEPGGRGATPRRPEGGS